MNSLYTYTEDGVRGETDVEGWSKWMSKNKHLCDDTVGGVRVSTVFLGVDHSFGIGGPPILFETMIFGGEHGGYQDRCCTYDEAVVMHQKAYDLVNKGNN